MADITKILSYDPASTKNLGWSLITIYEDKEKITNIEVKAGTFVFKTFEEQWMVLWPMQCFVEMFISEQKPELLILEKTSSFSGGFVTGQVSNCLGVILAACGKYGVPVKFVYPTHVKKIITGKGKATKSEMKKHVKQILNDITKQDVNFDSEHAYDATANILTFLKDSKHI